MFSQIVLLILSFGLVVLSFIWWTFLIWLTLSILLHICVYQHYHNITFHLSRQDEIIIHIMHDPIGIFSDRKNCLVLYNRSTLNTLSTFYCLIKVMAKVESEHRVVYTWVASKWGKATLKDQIPLHGKNPQSEECSSTFLLKSKGKAEKNPLTKSRHPSQPRARVHQTPPVLPCRQAYGQRKIFESKPRSIYCSTLEWANYLLSPSTNSRTENEIIPSSPIATF